MIHCFLLKKEQSAIDNDGLYILLEIIPSEMWLVELVRPFIFAIFECIESGENRMEFIIHVVFYSHFILGRDDFKFASQENSAIVSIFCFYRSIWKLFMWCVFWCSLYILWTVYVSFATLLCQYKQYIVFTVRNFSCSPTQYPSKLNHFVFSCRCTISTNEEPSHRIVFLSK